jgi:hypothetical protein
MYIKIVNKNKIQSNLNSNPKAGPKIKLTMFVLFKGIADTEQIRKHSNFNSNINLKSLILRFTLLMEFLILIPNFNNILKILQTNIMV